MTCPYQIKKLGKAAHAQKYEPFFYQVNFIKRFNVAAFKTSDYYLCRSHLNHYNVENF